MDEQRPGQLVNTILLRFGASPARRWRVDVEGRGAVRRPDGPQHPAPALGQSVGQQPREEVRVQHCAFEVSAGADVGQHVDPSLLAEDLDRERAHVVDPAVDPDLDDDGAQIAQSLRRLP